MKFLSLKLAWCRYVCVSQVNVFIVIDIIVLQHEAFYHPFDLLLMTKLEMHTGRAGPGLARKKSNRVQAGPRKI